MTAAELDAHLRQWARTGVPAVEAARRLGLQRSGQSAEDFAAEVQRRVDAMGVTLSRSRSAV